MCEFYHITVTSHHAKEEKIENLIKEEKESLMSATAPTYVDVNAQRSEKEKSKFKEIFQRKLEDSFSPREVEENTERSGPDIESKLAHQDSEINLEGNIEEPEIPKS